MADVLVDGSPGTNCCRVNRSGPVYVNELVGYMFRNSGEVEMYKTEDGGATWDAPVEITTTKTPVQLDVWFDKWTPGDTGDLIHIVLFDAGANDDAGYIAFDTSDDSVGTYQIAYDGISMGNGLLNTQMSITKAVGGNIYIVVQERNVGSDNVMVRATSPTADDWTARTSPDEGESNTLHAMMLLPDPVAADTQDIVGFYWDRVDDEVTMKFFDESGNSWSESSGAIINAFYSGNHWSMSAVIRLSDNKIILAVNTERDSASADLAVREVDPSDGGSFTVLTDVFTDTAESSGCGLYIDQNTDDLRVVYVRGATALGTDDTVYYQVSRDGGITWDGEVTYSEDTPDNFLDITAGHSTPGVAPGRFQPAFFNNDLDDLYVNFNNSEALGVDEAGGDDSPVMVAYGGSIQRGSDTVVLS